MPSGGAGSKDKENTNCSPHFLGSKAFPCPGARIIATKSVCSIPLPIISLFLQSFPTLTWTCHSEVSSVSGTRAFLWIYRDLLCLLSLPTRATARGSTSSILDQVVAILMISGHATPPRGSGSGTRSTESSALCQPSVVGVLPCLVQ